MILYSIVTAFLVKGLIYQGRVRFGGAETAAPKWPSPHLSWCFEHVLIIGYNTMNMFYL